MAEINNTLSNTLLTGTSGDDSILNGGWWDDSHHDGGSNVTITTGAGNDYVDNYGDMVTINTGAGNDEIDNEGIGIEINTGEGNDSVSNSYLSTASTINTGIGNDVVWNRESFCLINTDIGNDSVLNGELGYGSIINTGKGNDEIYNDGYDAEINTGTGNDSIYNNGGRVIINAGTGNDLIINNGDEVTISCGKGNDSIYSNGYQSDGNIYYYNKNYPSNVLFKYSSGDGYDLIHGFKADSTLSIAGGAYSTAKSGDDVIVTVGDGKISLIGAASLSAVNIVGEETPIETNSWTLDGTTAKYGTSSNTLVTVSNVKSLDGLSLSGKVVTIDNSSVNKKKITISGDGYTLKLADGLAPTTKKAVWSIKDTTATYKSSYKTAGYTLAKDSKSISYSKATTATILATVKGVKSIDGLSVKNKVVTVAASSLNKKKVTITGDGYTLKLADGLAPSTKKADWSLDGTTATYKSSYKTAGYTLAKNSKSITYSKATMASGLATITGAASTSGLSVSSKKITLKKSALNSKVTVSGSGYDFNFASDYKKATITGSKNADIITTNGTKLSVNGGKGNDTIKVYGSTTTVKGGAGDDTLAGGAGADIFLYFDGDGDDVITDYAAIDKIKIIGNSVEPENSGRDVVLKVGTGKITVKNAVRNNIDVTYIENGIECGYIGGERTVSINGAIVTLNDNYRKNIFDISEAKGITKINASDFNRDGLTIKGNAEKNIITSAKGNCTLIGGKGDDTLFGDDGANLYVYSNGDGHDVIQNYGEGDQISIKSGTVSNIVTSGKNVIFTIGKGKISVMGAASKDIYYSVGGKDSIHYADENNTTGNLFASEDDILLEDSNAQLNSIIKNNSTDYSSGEFSDSTNLIKENNYAFHIAFRGQSV